MANLLTLIKEKQLIIPNGYFEQYDDKNTWRKMLYDKEWVVYTKKPFSSSKHVINYLGRYSHRVAITDHRIINSDCEYVYFKWKDYKDGAKKKILKIKGTEFIRRFKMHILPPHYRKIRSFGFVSNASKAKSITIARKALRVKITQLLTRNERKELAKKRLFGSENINTCPCCKKGKMKTIFGINKNRPPPPELLNKIKNQNSE